LKFFEIELYFVYVVRYYVHFHEVDMIRECARSFLDERGVDQYQFSGSHEYYQHVLERIYRPLVERGLIQEMENNNYNVPEGSRLREICRRELIINNNNKAHDGSSSSVFLLTFAR
jgi:hypothetical protein